MSNKKKRGWGAGYEMASAMAGRLGYKGNAYGKKMADRRRQPRETGRDRIRSAGSRSRSRSPIRERERPKEKNVAETKAIDREKVCVIRVCSSLGMN